MPDFNGTVTAQSTVDSNISVTKQFNFGLVDGQSTTNSPPLLLLISGTVICPSTVDGNIDVEKQVNAVVTNGSGVLDTSVEVQKDIVGTTTCTSITSDIAFEGSFSGTVTSQSTTNSPIFYTLVDGSTTGQSTANSPSLIFLTLLTGTATGQSDVPFPLVINFVVSKEFDGTIVAQSIVAPASVPDTTFSSIVSVVSNIPAVDIVSAKTLSGTVVGQCTTGSPGLFQLLNNIHFTFLIGSAHSNSYSVLVVNDSTVNFAGFSHSNTTTSLAIPRDSVTGISNVNGSFIVTKVFAGTVEIFSSVPFALFVGSGFTGTVTSQTLIPGLQFPPIFIGNVRGNSQTAFTVQGTVQIAFGGSLHGNTSAVLRVASDLVGDCYCNSDAQIVVTGILLTNFVGSCLGNSFAALTAFSPQISFPVAKLIVDPAFTVSTSTCISNIPVINVVVQKQLIGDVTGSSISTASMIGLIVMFSGASTGLSTIPDANCTVTKTFSAVVIGNSTTSGPPLPTVVLIGSLGAGTITDTTLQVVHNKVGTVTGVLTTLADPLREQEDMAGAIIGVSVTGMPFAVLPSAVITGDVYCNSDVTLVVSGFVGTSHGNTSAAGVIFGGSSVSLMITKQLLFSVSYFAGFSHGNSSVAVAIPASITLVGSSYSNSDVVLVVNDPPEVLAQSNVPPAEFDSLVLFSGESTPGTAISLITYNINVIATGNSQAFVYRKYRGNSSWTQVQVTPPGSMTGSFRAIAHNGTYYLLISDSGFVFKSNDPEGNTWTNTAQIGNDYPTGLEYSSALGYWMVIFRDGRAYKSIDGVTWTYIPTSHGKQLFGLAQGQNVFIAVGESGILSRYNGFMWEITTIDPHPKTNFTGSIHGNSFTTIAQDGFLTGDCHTHSYVSLVTNITPFVETDTPYFGIEFANDVWIMTGLNYIIRSTDAFATYDKVLSLETNTINSFGSIVYGGRNTWVITGDEVIRYSFDHGLTWFESFIRFRASRDAVFDGNRWFVVDSALTAQGQGKIIQNGAIEHAFGMLDEDTDYPFVVTLQDPYIVETNNVRIFIEYPINNFMPFRRFELEKGLYWEEIGIDGRFSKQIRILAPPHLVSPDQPILALNVLTKQIQIPRNWTDIFVQGFKFRILNSGVGNDGVYTTVSSTYSIGIDRTTITVVESFVSATVSGQVGDDNQLLNKHVIAEILSFFDWETSTLTNFEMFNIATNHQQISFGPSGFLITILVGSSSSDSTAQDGPSFEFTVGDGICPFPGNTVDTPLQVFAFIKCEDYPIGFNPCANDPGTAFPPNPC